MTSAIKARLIAASFFALFGALLAATYLMVALPTEPLGSPLASWLLVPHLVLALMLVVIRSVREASLLLIASSLVVIVDLVFYAGGLIWPPGAVGAMALPVIPGFQLCVLGTIAGLIAIGRYT